MTRVYDALRRALDEADEDSLLDMERASLGDIGIADAGGAFVDSLLVEAKLPPLPREEPRYREDLRQREEPRAVPTPRPPAPMPAPAIDEPEDVDSDAAPDRDVAPGRSRKVFLVGAAALVAIAAIVLLVRPFAGAAPTALRLTGVIAANEIVIAPTIGGRITELKVNEGTNVTRGQLLARLDRREIDTEREQQAAAISQIAWRLQQSRQQASLQAETVSADLSRAQAKLREARSQELEQGAQLELQRKEAARAQSLFDQQLLPAQELERTKSALQVDEARVRAAVEQRTAAEADVALAMANARQTTVANQEVARNQAELEQARAQSAQIDTKLAYTNVFAPIDGTVSTRVAREGEVVAAGAPIVTLVDLNDVWVRADVEESYIQQLTLGQSLEVELQSGERRTAHVTFISPEPEFATQRDVSRVKRDIRTFGIKAAIPNQDRRLHSGMTVYVELPVGSTRSARAR